MVPWGSPNNSNAGVGARCCARAGKREPDALPPEADTKQGYCHDEVRADSRYLPPGSWNDCKHRSEEAGTNLRCCHKWTRKREACSTASGNLHLATWLGILERVETPA